MVLPSFGSILYISFRLVQTAQQTIITSSTHRNSHFKNSSESWKSGLNPRGERNQKCFAQSQPVKICWMDSTWSTPPTQTRLVYNPLCCRLTLQGMTLCNNFQKKVLTFGGIFECHNLFHLILQTEPEAVFFTLSSIIQIHCSFPKTILIRLQYVSLITAY